MIDADAFLRKLINPVDRLISILIWIYISVLIIWFFGRATIGDKSILILLINFLGVWLFFPLVFFLLWAILHKQKKNFILLIPPLVLFLIFYGPYFIPHSTTGVDNSKSITVLTFNVRNNNPEVDSISKMLISSHADLLALQEVTEIHERYLLQTLTTQYPYHDYIGKGNLAVYSKYPILEQKSNSSVEWPVQSVIVQINTKELQFINAHFARVGLLEFETTFDGTQVRELEHIREDQIALIDRIIDENKLPTIVACDCNMTSLNTAYAQITSTLEDAFRNRGWGLGNTILFPRAFDIQSFINFPFQRIDYLFYSPDINVLKVGLNYFHSGSDHLPLWAQFDLQQDENVLTHHQKSFAR